MNIQQIIDIIRNLTNKTVERGCTEAEALAAANKVASLMENYNLSLDKVFLEESHCERGEIKTGRQRRHPISWCLKAIGDFCDCKVWEETSTKNWIFFGMPTDVSLAKYLYWVIYNAIDSETWRYKCSNSYIFASANRKSLSTSFQKGMACRVSERLREMLATRKANENKVNVGGNCTSLIIVKNSKVQKEFEEIGIKLNKTTVKLRANITAFQTGQERGNNVSLNRPVGNNSIQGFLQ